MEAADDSCDPTTDQCVAIGTFNVSFAIGVGKRQNPVVGRKDIPLHLVPQISYYGERFYLENLDIGYTLYENPTSSLSIAATPGYDRVFFYEGDPQNTFIDTAANLSHGLQPNNAFEADPSDPELQDLIEERDRDTTYLGGIEWVTGFRGAQVQVDLLHELTGKHNGNEIRTAIAFPLINRQSRLSLTLGATWKSSEVVTYYYGAPNFFEMDASIIPFIKLGYQRRLNSHWSILALVHYQRLGSDVTISPIIKDNKVATTFLGGVYSF